MANSAEEILLTLKGQDNASSVFSQVDSNAQSMASKISSAVSSMNSAMMNFGSVTDNVMQGLTGKSALDNILGTSSKAETNKVLLNNMTETKEGAEKLYETVDKVTDSSLTSMQELIPAMKAFKSATGASDKEMTNITDDMANFGAAVLAQTGSTELAQGAMMDLSKGIGGAFAALDQYGVTEESLQRTGYWNGDEKDVEGFMKAVTKVTGSTKELMETNQGLDALIGKAFSRAGKKMGNEFLPQIKDIKRAFLDIDESTGGGLSATILGVSGAIEVANRGFTNVSTIIRGVEDLSSAFNAIKGIGKGAEVVGDAVSGASAVGALAGEAGAASAGVEATAVATTSLSASFTSMIVPLLAMAAVIAIMLPIAAGIAIEALLLLKAIQMVFQALDFGGIDLSKSVDGIKQIAEGLAWVGVAMAAMSFASIMTGLAIVTSGFLGITGPLEIAKDALMEAARALQEFSSVTIDQSVPENIKKIGESLDSVSQAMMALTSLTITTGFSNFVAWALDFGSVTDALEQAKTEIMDASSKLNEFSGLTPLPDSVATNIQNVCNSLASVGDAMSALRSLRDGQNWDTMIGDFLGGIFGGVDIQTALANVKQDIINASAALAEFTGITTIPEGVGEKVKSVATTLSSVSEAFETLRSLRDNTNWDGFMGGIFGGVDIASALDQIKTDLLTAGQKLAELSQLPDITEDTTTKITNIGKALTEVSNVVTTLSQLPPMEGFDTTSISTAVQSVQTAATELAKLNEITFNGEAANNLLTSITTALENLKTTLSGMGGGFSAASVNIGSGIVSGVQSGLSPLGSTITGAVSSAINSAGSAALSGGTMLGRATTSGMKSSLQLKSTMETEVGYALEAITSKEQAFYDAGAALGRAANEGFQSQPAINPGSPGNLAHVMMDEVDYILEAMTSKYKAAKSTAQGLGRSIYQGFTSTDLGLLENGTLSIDQIGSLGTSISRTPNNTANSVTIIVSEGAIPIDARNMTEQESRGIMLTALESLDHITNIEVGG